LQITTFCPQVHDALFGRVSVAPSYTTYEVACKFCRRTSLFAVPRAPTLTPDQNAPRPE
jgi:hypothetical protein